MKTTTELVKIYLDWLKKKNVIGLSNPMTFNQILDLVADTMEKNENKQICERPSVHNCPIDVDGLCMSFHPCVYKKHED